MTDVVGVLADLPRITIGTVRPNEGTTAGGTVVSVTGANFTADASAKIGGVAATVEFVSVVQLRVTSPAHAAGAVNVAVTNLVGTATRGAGRRPGRRSSPGRRRSRRPT